ncbi:MAG TPA: endospore germination permease [Symbiobacteriaceae bacterium]|nr:endospore germination permease [Symbiobacteriaceae bacterium]
MKRWEISALQSAMLIAGIVALTGHALAVTHFVRAGGRDSWLSGVVAFPIGLLAFWSFVKLRRMFPGDTLVQFLPKILGYAGYLVAAIFVLYFFTVVVFTLRMTTDWMVDSILPETPSWVMGVLYMAAVAYTAAGGLDVLARVNQFTLPLLSGLGVLVSVGTLQAKDYHLLLPLFEKGYGPVLASAFLGLGYLGECSVLPMYDAYVVQGDYRKLMKVYFIALVYIFITLTGPMAGSIATLGYRVALNMPYPTFQHWLMVNLTRFFERTDLLAVHQWLAGAYVRCGIYLLMGIQGIRQLTPARKIPFNWLLAVFSLLTVGVSEYAWHSKPVFDQWVLDVYLPGGAFLGMFLPPLLLIVAWVRKLGRPNQGAQTYGG